VESYHVSGEPGAPGAPREPLGVTFVRMDVNGASQKATTVGPTQPRKPQIPTRRPRPRPRVLWLTAYSMVESVTTMGVSSWFEIWG